MPSRKYPLPEEELRSEIVKFRLTPDEKEALGEITELLEFDDTSKFIRFWIKDLIKTKGSGGVISISTIGQTATDGAQRIPDAPPGKFVWEPEIVDKTGEVEKAMEP